jgi:peptidoglycan/LPS O-acetylase OafA/YrhL
MNPVSPLPALAALLAALGTTVLLVKRFGAPKQEGRFAAIDGLRGYLAFFVFVHHAAIWYFFLRSSEWKAAPSNLYTHFGQTSVAMFFMITGFLFFTKLLNGRRRPVDWLQLAVSRVMRLAPLYLFAMLCLFTIVTVISGGVLNVPESKLAKSVIQWMLFTVAGAPDVNGVAQTSNILARVLWTLPYEWFFYLSLPLLALGIRVDVPRRYVVLGAVAMGLMLVVWRPETHNMLSFLGGIVAAVVAASKRLDGVASSKWASVAVIACLAAVVVLFPTTHEPTPVLLISVAFTLIACGANLFGVLTHAVSRTLGEMAYSIYLLHGLVLFLFFHWLPRSGLGLPGSVAHWAFVVALTPVLIGLSFLTFSGIEKPAMQSTARVTQWLRLRFGKVSAVAV